MSVVKILENIGGFLVVATIVGGPSTLLLGPTIGGPLALIITIIIFIRLFREK